MQGLNFTFDMFDKMNLASEIYLGDANENIKHCIPKSMLYDFKGKFFLNSLSDITFKIYKYFYSLTGEEYILPAYDYIGQGINTIMIPNIGLFVLYNYDVNIEGKTSNPYKTCTFKSLETEFENVMVYSNDKSNSDESTDNMYYLCNDNDIEHSCLHLAIEQLPHWSISYIDPNISTSAHNFSTFDSVTAYEFLTTNVAESFKCFFVFNTFTKEIYAYKEKNPFVAKDSNIYLDWNVIKNIGLKYNPSEITTVLNVSGGSDSTVDGGVVGIWDVNPAGNSQISCFDYVYQFFSDGLKVAYDYYIEAYNYHKEIYSNNSLQLQTYYSELETLKYHEETNENWSTYGLSQLEQARDSFYEVMGSYVSLNTNVTQQQYSIAVQKYNAVLLAIESKRQEIESKQSQINELENLMSHNILHIRDYLTDEQYKEFIRYRRVSDYVDDTIVITDSMTNQEIIEAETELMNNAFEELFSIAFPRFEMVVNAINFTTIPQFKNYTQSLDLGTLIHINFGVKNENGIDTHLHIRLLEVELDFSNPENISLVFSNKDSLTEQFRLKEIQEQASSARKTLSYNMSNIKESTSKTNSFKRYMQSDRNLMDNRIISSNLEDVVVDTNGILLRSKLSNGGYDNRQTILGHGGIVITKDSWNTISTGIGEILLPDGRYGYGINAEIVYGDLLIGSGLEIKNDSNNMLFDDNGLVINGANNSVKINPNDPTSIFTILKGSTPQIYFDVNGNAHFNGSLESGTINIGNGAFTVSNYGDINITRGTMSIGNKFSVTQEGTLTAVDGNFRGIINATGGNIAGFIIDEHQITSYDIDLTKPNPYEGVNLSKFIRISPYSLTNGVNNYTTDYGAIDLGLTEDGKNTLIHLRSDGYARFGLSDGVRGGSIRFNYYKDENGINLRYILYTKTFTIDEYGLVKATNINSPSIHSDDQYLSITGDRDISIASFNLGEITIEGGNVRIYSPNIKQVKNGLEYNVLSLNDSASWTASKNYRTNGLYNLASVDYVQEKIREVKDLIDDLSSDVSSLSSSVSSLSSQVSSIGNK